MRFPISEYTNLCPISHRFPSYRGLLIKLSLLTGGTSVQRIRSR